MKRSKWYNTYNENEFGTPNQKNERYSSLVAMRWRKQAFKTGVYFKGHHMDYPPWFVKDSTIHGMIFLSTQNSNKGLGLFINTEGLEVGDVLSIKYGGKRNVEFLKEEEDDSSSRLDYAASIQPEKNEIQYKVVIDAHPWIEKLQEIPNDFDDFSIFELFPAFANHSKEGANAKLISHKKEIFLEFEVVKSGKVVEILLDYGDEYWSYKT
jgi:hypothetical protein